MIRLKTKGAGLILVWGAVAVLALGGALMGAWASPATVVETRSVQERAYTLQASMDYEAELQENTSLWTAGTRLPAGHTIYFYHGRPLLRIKPAINLTGSAGARLRGVLEVRVLARAIQSDTGSAWSYEVMEPQSFNVELTASGGRNRFEVPPVTLNAAGLKERFDALAKELNYTGMEHRVEIQLQLKGEAQANGQVLAASLSPAWSIRFDPAGAVFPVAEKLVVSHGVEQTLTREVPVSRSYATRLNAYWPQLVAALMGFGLAATLALRSRRDPPGLAGSAEHRKYRSWITNGQVRVGDERVSEVETLEGLVELAVDMNKRVIFDVRQQGYFVFDDRTVYVHSPGQSRIPPQRDEAASCPDTGSQQVAPSLQPEAPEAIATVAAESFSLDPWITQVPVKSLPDLRHLAKLSGRTLIQSDSTYYLIDGSVCFFYRKQA